MPRFNRANSLFRKTSSELSLQISGAVKRYGSLNALDGVSIVFEPGQIHAVVGENGAGKSTLMGVIAGLAHLDAGTMSFRGSRYQPQNVRDAKKCGIGIVHQHFKHVPTFTSEENLALAKLTTPWGKADCVRLSAKGLQIADTLGWTLPARDRPVGEMPVGTQQRLEIVKVLADDAEIVILDEPTAVLSPSEVDDVFRVLRNLRSAGKTIILIAHKLSEVFSIADHITVLRHGRVVGGGAAQDLTPAQVAEWMIGDLPVRKIHRDEEFGDTIATASEVRIRPDSAPITLSFRAGEIVGIGGVDGNGQVELAEILALIRRPSTGTVTSPVPALIPQDRQVDGLAMQWSIEQNLWVAGHLRREFRLGPFLKVRALKGWADALARQFQVKFQSVRQPVRSLSGGNQQKVVVGRALSESAKFVVALNPTRGLDVGSAAYVHDQLKAVTSANGSVALFSTDLDELHSIADRIYVMVSGSLHELQSASSMVGAD
ncbi:MAG TPA: ATP-binding cassette domain-containing protein [Fimbriimonadaceae bacterium]|nr:ATP-binding cassette domain-containing protein [Fimbriimonadaceae bacterium]